MSQNGGPSEAQSGYKSLTEVLKRTRLRQDRPHSDGDVWATLLSQRTSFPHRNITDHSCLKVYHKDPAQAFSHGPRPTNGDARVSAPLSLRQCLISSSGCGEITRFVAIKTVSAFATSSHSHILFAVEERNVPPASVNLFEKGFVLFSQGPAFGPPLHALLQLV